MKFISSPGFFQGVPYPNQPIHHGQVCFSQSENANVLPKQTLFPPRKCMCPYVPQNTHPSFPALLLLVSSGVTIPLGRERPACVCAPVSSPLWLRTLFHQEPETLGLNSSLTDDNNEPLTNSRQDIHVLLVSPDNTGIPAVPPPPKFASFPCAWSAGGKPWGSPRRFGIT